MRIYVSHKRLSNFEKDLYEPLKNSEIAKGNQLILPHDNNPQSFNVKDLFKNGEVDVVIAEVSYPATGQGIELAWAEEFGIPIICVYKSGADISGSLKFITDKFIEYSDMNDLTKQLTNYLSMIHNS